MLWLLEMMLFAELEVKVEPDPGHDAYDEYEARKKELPFELLGTKIIFKIPVNESAGWGSVELLKGLPGSSLRKFSLCAHEHVVHE